jgi:hypothetical protein
VPLKLFHIPICTYPAVTPASLNHALSAFLRPPFVTGREKQKNCERRR